MTDWFQEFTDDGEWRFPRYPARVPKGVVKKYFWNEKCLVAPKPYFDSEGYYYWREWLIRKIVPGLLPMSEPIKSLPSDKDIVNSLAGLMKRHSERLGWN